MKKFKLFAGAAAALAMGILPSCSDNDISQVQKPEVSEVDQTQYMAVTISAPIERSRSYEVGSKDESKVTRFDFFFYDINRNPTAKMQSYDSDKIEEEFDQTEGPFDDTTTDNVTDRWTSIIPVQLVQGQNIPAYVICIVNAQSVSGLETKTMDELRDINDQHFLGNSGNFIMSNSTYFGLDVMTGERDARLCATPILASQLYATKEAAQKAMHENNEDGSKYVNIYVERLAAKVGLTMTSDAPKDYILDKSAGGTVTLKFVPEYWFMNCIAKNNYITKRYGLQDKDNSNTPPTITYNYTPTKAQIDSKFANTGMANTWNKQEDHRSFWGVSPSYYNGNYPLVSDQINDLLGSTGDYNQKYYSYNEVRSQATGKIGAQAIQYNNGFSTSIAADKSSGYIYTRETTTAIGIINEISDGNPAATVGSAVIVGYYTVGGTKPTEAFYIDRHAGTNENGVYYGTAELAKAALVSRQNILYKSNPRENTDAAKADAGSFIIEHPKKAVREKLANPNIAGRLVTLQLPSVPTPALYWYDSSKSQSVPVSTENINQVNAQLVSTGYMDMFNKGRAFFSVPIRHLGFPQAVNNKVTTPDGKTLYEKGVYHWGNMRLGDLGIIRNHVYTLNVNSISGLGTGLRDDDQPILPPKDAVNQWVAVRLNILSWNVVTGWNVDL